MARTGTAVWKGDLQQGEGTLALGSGAYEGPYSYKSRFEEGAGTNPEEMIGAAEAGCFTMALSLALSEKGTPPEELRTEAKVTLRNVDGIPTITRIDLTLRGRVDGVDEATFKEMAGQAKEQCIVSRALGGVDEITLDATLES
jgi:osmotically inducible protein OsmC